MIYAGNMSRRAIRRRLILALVVFAIGTSLVLVCLHDMRAVCRTKHAISNGHFIETAKEAWAGETGATNGTAVTVGDLEQYWGHAHTNCYSGGVVTVGAIGEDPACTVHGPLSTTRSPDFRPDRRLLFYGSWF